MFHNNLVFPDVVYSEVERPKSQGHPSAATNVKVYGTDKK